MSTSNNVFQQVFEISMAANMVQHDKETAAERQHKLAKKLPHKLESIHAGWKVVWGPAVTAPTEAEENILAQSTIPGTSWFVASAAQIEFEDDKFYPLYVVAIGSAAGFEKIPTPDSAIGLVVDLDKWASSGPDGLKIAPPPVQNNPSILANITCIANGFGQAIFRILNETRGGEQTALLSFLRRVFDTEPEARIVFTGHSLAGALSPSLAYTLAKANVFGSKPSSRVFVYPTAGQSPGNRAFVENFSSHYPSPSGPLEGYQHWNANIINPSDIVPCGYCMDAAYTPSILENVPAMYGSPALEAVQNAVSLLEGEARGLYYPIHSSSFASPIPKPPQAPKKLTVYFDAAWKQHVDAYKAYILGIQPSSDSEAEVGVDYLLGYPVLGGITALQTED